MSMHAPSSPLAPLPALPWLIAGQERWLRRWCVVVVALGFVACGLGLIDHWLSTLAGAWWSSAPTAMREMVTVVRPFGRGEALVLFALALGAAGRRRPAVALLVGLAAMSLLVWVLKLGFERPRPSGNGFSFPSGDAATAATALPVLIAWLRGQARILVVATAALVAVLIAVFRVLMLYHFPSDVVTGLALGIVGGALGVRLTTTWRIRPGARWFALGALLLVAGIFIILQWPGRHIQIAQLQPLMLVAVPALSLGIGARWLRASLHRRSRHLSLRPATWWLAGLVAGLLLFATTRSTLWDRDEPRYAKATVEMVDGGDWLVPSFNGEPRLHKPILIYWLMALPVSLLGPSELACRFWAPLALACSLLLIAGWGRRLGEESAGFWAAAALATMPLALVVGTAATTDAVLLLTILLALWPWFAALGNSESRSSWPRAIAMGLAMGLALLVKGPVGLAVPVLTLVVARWWLRRDLPPPPPLARDLTVAVLVACAVFLAWAIPANAATGGAFLSEGVGKHVIGRTLAPMEGHGGRFWSSLPYYVPVLLVACLPWTAFLPAVFSAMCGGRLPRRVVVTACALFLPTFLLMSLVATKLPHYILPAVPGLALLVGWIVAELGAGRLHPDDQRWLERGRWLAVVPFGLIGAVLLVSPWIVPLHAAGAAASGVGAVFLVMTVWSAREWVARPALVARILVLGMLVVQLASVMWLVPGLEAFKPAPVVAAAVCAASTPDVPVCTAGYDEPSLLFYLRRTPVRNLGNQDDLIRAWSVEPGPGVLVITNERLVSSGIAALPGIHEVHRCSGWNYSNGKQVELITLGRNLPVRPGG